VFAVKKSTALWFIAPALFFFLTFVIAPLLSSVYLSLTSWDGLNSEIPFVGLQNFDEIAHSERFWHALGNTFVIAIALTLGWNAIALGLALLVDNVRWGKNAFRVAFYIPVLLSGIVVGFIWSILYNYNFGVINAFLEALGLGDLRVDWLGQPRLTVPALIVTLLWQSSGYYMVIYLAALQGIPQELVEAAKIDGANRRSQFWNITLPLIAGAMTVNLTLALISGMKVFDQIAIMTDGGPGFTSENVIYLIYKVAFGEGRQGFGTAMALVLFAVILVFAVIQVRVLRRREVQL